MLRHLCCARFATGNMKLIQGTTEQYTHLAGRPDQLWSERPCPITVWHLWTTLLHKQTERHCSSACVPDRWWFLAMFSRNFVYVSGADVVNNFIALEVCSLPA